MYPAVPSMGVHAHVQKHVFVRVKCQSERSDVGSCFKRCSKAGIHCNQSAWYAAVM
jgi:hypothetical protein